MDIYNNLSSEEYKSRIVIKNENASRLCKKCNCQLQSFVRDNNGKRIDCRHRVYCLTCSPVGVRKMCGRPPKYWERGTTKGNRKIKYDKICKTCGKIFHQAGRNLECTTCRSKKVREINKSLAIEYKGGKCSKCGYKKCSKALEFHHLDQSSKEFQLSEQWGNKFEKIKIELDKCILVCANCHRELHEGMVAVVGFEPTLC